MKADAEPKQTEQVESVVEASTDEEQAQPRTRSRRSPRHLRAAGQRRRHDTMKNQVMRKVTLLRLFQLLIKPLQIMKLS